MSSCRDPPTTSNGSSWSAPGSSWSIFGTTVVPRVSMTPHVRVSVNCSPTSTALLSVFHQHLIGSIGVCTAIVPIRIIIENILTFPPLHSHLPQSPLSDELHENRSHLPPIQADPDNVEVRIPRQPDHFLLPI